ncbi:MAG: hypothetical protein IKO36_01180 [Bacteroidaceae bacterium]|nr:hypothetical protein [Bacteroidaceae bacterium]
MEYLKTKIKPDYDTCCGCIDTQILGKTRKDCEECKKLRGATLYSFVREKGKTYGVIGYDNGALDTVELWRIRIANKEKNV